ncbi:MAG: transglycosylase domain-containing protein [Blautia sp.]|nr:transglycosylase domain-containing protein [Blautia sp.]
MNYGKKAISRKRNSLISSSSMLGKKAHVSLIRILFLGLLAVIVALLCLGAGSIRGVIAGAPDVNTIDIQPLGYATFLYDSTGKQLRKLAAPDSNRLPVIIDDDPAKNQIPQDLQDAVVAIEDERFYEHNGIDVRGILRAAVRAIQTGTLSEGASTITQQLLKNNVFPNWTSESSWLEKFTRKFQEQYLALAVEKKIGSKQVILENYLNTINLGAGAYGVQAASKQYFNKDVWDLNLSECATLAGITQNPTKYNPIDHPEANKARKEEVLDHMLAQGYIEQEEYEQAMSDDDVYRRIQDAQDVHRVSTSTVYTYFEDELISQVINDLINMCGYSRAVARNKVYSGGLKIYTTQDPSIQRIVDEEYADESNYPDGTQYALDFALTVADDEGNQTNYSKEMLRLYFQDTEDPSFSLLFDSPEAGQEYVDKYKAYALSQTPGGHIFAERVSFAPQPQSSMSIIEQDTGYVRALIGGRGKKTASLTLNRATDSTRQPGSTFKIVSTYAPALDTLGLSLATVFVDEPYNYPNGSPVNNASMTFGGETTIRQAITNSVNVVAVKCLEQVTPDLGLKYLTDRFGFTTLATGDPLKDTDYLGNVWSDANLATALGGITHGVTNVELCAAYAAIANGGKYRKPTYYTRIEDRNGNILIDNTNPGTKVAIKDTTAWLLTSAMEDVVNEGTGTMCRINGQIVAGKTGTTEAYNDLWFVGYTPYYTCAVWSGYDNNEKIPDPARNFHKELWQKVMSRIHEGLPEIDFVRPAGITEATVCSESGLLAQDYCPAITEYFDSGTVPEEYCEMHWYDYDYGYGYGFYDEYGNYYTYSPDTGETIVINPNTGLPYGAEGTYGYDTYTDYGNGGYDYNGGYTTDYGGYGADYGGYGADGTYTGDSIITYYNQ